MTLQRAFIQDIYSGAYDDDLDEIVKAISERRKIISLQRAVDNLSTLAIGDRVKLTNISPKYMNNRPATIIGFDGRKIKVDMGMRIGKYAQVLTVDSSCIVRS